jgi:DHA2 family multidrug resistance protein
MVSDPPHLRAMRERSQPVDTIGLSLIAIGLAALEVVLDKGQEEDWFQSPFILVFSLIAGFALVGFVVWEWHHEHPIVDVRMFKNRNFAASNVMMFTLGIALFGTTVLLPQYTQVVMRYTAQQAGMVLSPGGFVIILLLPLVGGLVSKVDPRYLIAFGFAASSAALFYMTNHLYAGIDFHTAMMLRIYQCVGLAFLFVPINSLVYNGVPPEKNNAVSGIVNLSRNIGADVGIAFVTTFIARRSQFHQANLAEHTNVYSADFNARVAGIAAAIEHTGASTVLASKKAVAAVYGQMLSQAATLATLDAIKVLAILTGLMVPLLFLTEKRKPGAVPAGH